MTGGLTTWIVTVSDALLLSCGQVAVTVTGTGPSCIGAVHGVDCAVALVNVPAGALHRYVTVQPIESFTVAVTVDVLPTSTVHGLQAAFTDSVCSGAGGGGGGGSGGGGGAPKPAPGGKPRPQPQSPSSPRPLP